MNKVNKIIPLIIIIVLIITKMIIINEYKIDSKDIERLAKIKESLIIKDLLVINKEECDNYLEFKNIKIKNMFVGYVCREKDDSYLCQKDNSSFLMKRTNTYLNKFENYNDKSKTIIRKLNIKNELELLSKIKESKNKRSIFSSINNNEDTYILNSFALDNLNDITSIDLVEGDYSGYIIHHSKDSLSLLIYKKKDVYEFKFNNLEVFNDDIIKSLMNSIVIE